MKVTPMKKLASSILFLFKIAFCKMNNCEVLLKSLRASAHLISTLLSVSCNMLTSTTPTPTSTDLNQTVKEEFVTLEQVNIVLGRLGIQQCCACEGGGVDVLSVFEDEEASLSEVKVAFDVFDENSDGFIDEFELQKVLRNLGLLGMGKLEECRSMIKGFDVNGDGLIDFDEFVKLMETCSF